MVSCLSAVCLFFFFGWQDFFQQAECKTVADFDPTAAGSGINRATTVPPSAAAGGVSQGSPLLLERAMSC